MTSEEKPDGKLQDKLIDACLKNDRKAQLKLYNLYAKAMYNVCLNLVKNPSTSEDVMQEAFIAAFINLNRFKGEVTFGAWLKKITVNKCIDYLKRKKIDFENIEDYQNISSEQISNNNKLITKHSAKQIKDAVLILPDGYRTILSLYLFEGYDHEEISQILGISASTSRSQYTRAKAALVKKLKEVV